MTDGYINFDEYIRQGEPAQRERAEAWRVAIGLQAVFFPIDNMTLLPLRGEFGGHSPIPRTMSLANSLPPFQGVCGRCAPKGQPSGNTVCNAVTKLRDASNDAGMCAPQGQQSGSLMATPWATETPPSSSTSTTATPVSATNEKCIIAPKGHKQKRYGTIAL